MTMNTSDKPQTGYFNALTSGYFKTGADRRMLFFPWGTMGRGYAIPSAERYESMHRQLKIYMIVSLVLIIAPIAAQFYITGFAVAAALMVFYAAWTPILKRGLEPSEERMTMRDNMATQARIHNKGMLWAMEIAAILFVAGGIAMLIFDPRQWYLALFVAVFFGFCAIVIGRMIMVRQRDAAGQA
jgi:Ca2+/Na+ antiporter